MKASDRSLRDDDTLLCSRVEFIVFLVESLRRDLHPKIRVTEPQPNTALAGFCFSKARGMKDLCQEYQNRRKEKESGDRTTLFWDGAHPQVL